MSFRDRTIEDLPIPTKPDGSNEVDAQYLNTMKDAVVKLEMVPSVNLNLLNNWTTSSTWSMPSAYIINGTVFIEGYVTGGQTGRANKIATLPTGYKPPKYMKFMCAPNTVIQLDLNGDIWVETGSTSNVFLNGIVFRK